jgi:hypothetical protein
MPVNEILAPYYVKYRYTTPFAAHQGRLYFETGAELGTEGPLSPSSWTIRGSAAIQSVPIKDLVFQVINRMKSVIKPTVTLTNIEVWQSAAGVNTLVGLNDLPTVNTFTGGAGFAAAYNMVVFGTGVRQKFRLTFFDTASTDPQRVSLAQPPAVDDGFIGWYMLKSLVPFATQDGVRLTRTISQNTGYNRKLARAYGRFLT